VSSCKKTTCHRTEKAFPLPFCEMIEDAKSMTLSRFFCSISYNFFRFVYTVCIHSLMAIVFRIALLNTVTEFLTFSISPPPPTCLFLYLPFVQGDSLFLWLSSYYSLTRYIGRISLQHAVGWCRLPGSSYVSTHSTVNTREQTFAEMTTYRQL